MGYYQRAIEKYAKWVVEQSKLNLKKPKKPFGKSSNSSGKLLNSLDYKIQGDKISFLK